MSDDWENLENEIHACRKCPRLVGWREEVARVKRRAYQDWEYWGKPVAGFGDRQARLMIVGLAPGAHGANRTGRMFTGDGSGEFLFRALHRAGFANQPTSAHRQDGLELKDVYIGAACRCAPPDNKPAQQEISNCLPYLRREIELLPRLEGGLEGGLEGCVALGRVAFEALLRLFQEMGHPEMGHPEMGHPEMGHPLPRLAFAHGAQYRLGQGLPWLLASYHPSRQNTQTGRLTEAMFDEVWGKARELLGQQDTGRLGTPRGNP